MRGRKIYINKKELEWLLNLEQRLISDYSGDQEFYQYEEDRLIIGDILDKVGGNYACKR